MRRLKLLLSSLLVATVLVTAAPRPAEAVSWWTVGRYVTKQVITKAPGWFTGCRWWTPTFCAYDAQSR